MKIQAIVYKSKTGFTEKYAKLLSEATGIPCYPIKSAKQSVKKTDNVVFFGRVMASKIDSLKKATSWFNTVAVCGVGMSPVEGNYAETLKKANNLTSMPVFYVQGGYDTKNQGWLSSKMISMITADLQKKPDKSPSDEIMLDMLINGADLVNPEYLKPLIEFIK